MGTESNVAVGRRIAWARGQAGLSQTELATKLQIASYQSISELEQGNRRLKPEELLGLSRALGRDLQWFLDPFSLEGEAQFSWRRGRAEDCDSSEVESRVGSLVGLLRWLRSFEDKPRSALKPSLRLSKDSALPDAEAQAERLVVELELGDAPAEALESKVQDHLDVPILYSDFRNDADISGVTVHLSDLTCIVVNRNEVFGRRNFDLAHELFHALTWDAMPPAHLESNAISVRGSQKKSHVEKLADKFAAALLMPRASLEQRFRLTKAGDISHLLAIANYFSVSTPALAYRLLNLKLIDATAFNTLMNTRADIPSRKQPKLYTQEFWTLLSKRMFDGRISPRKAAKVLGVTLDELDDHLKEWNLPTTLEA